MVDRSKRLQAAELVEKFLSCEITNFEFQDRFPHSRADPALHAIETMLWFAYDDIRRHKLEGKWSLSAEGQQVFERCILFLRSDAEYMGPKSFVDLTASFKRVWYWISRKPRPAVPLPSWPFETLEQLKHARIRS